MGADHTKSVEMRISEISVEGKDSCDFFQLRSTAIVNRKECWYCRFGEFKEGSETGFCNFKKIK